MEIVISILNSGLLAAADLNADCKLHTGVLLKRMGGAKLK